MEDTIDSLGYAKILSAFDALWGYCKVPLNQRIAKAFTTLLGTNGYTRISFGLWNAPDTFQRDFDFIFSGVHCRMSLLYLDDVIIFCKDNALHLEHLEHVRSWRKAPLN